MRGITTLHSIYIYILIIGRVQNLVYQKGIWIYFPFWYMAILEEDPVTQVFAFNNMFYPVAITTEERSPLTGFPWIRPSDFLRAMSRMNDLTHLLGGHTLTESKHLLTSFWEKYRKIFPKHQLWAEVDSGRKDVTKCIPLYLHGDEGVCYKKSGVLVLSFQGAIGFGTSKSKRAKEVEENYKAMAKSEGIPLNFLRTGLQTRMLICVCPKECMINIRCDLALLCFIFFNMGDRCVASNWNIVH